MYSGICMRPHPWHIEGGRAHSCLGKARGTKRNWPTTMDYWAHSVDKHMAWVWGTWESKRGVQQHCKQPAVTTREGRDGDGTSLTQGPKAGHHRDAEGTKQSAGLQSAT